MSVDPGSSRRPPRISSWRWWRMAQKELREILRDRRTILTLIGMPLLIYPLLGVTFQRMLLSQAAAKSKTEYRIALASRHDSRIFRELLQQGEFIRAAQSGQEISSQHRPSGSPDDPVWEFLVSRDAESDTDVSQLVADRSADVGVRLVDSPEQGPWNFELTYRSTSSFSIDARRAVEERLRSINDLVISKHLHDADPPIRIPIAMTSKPVTSSDSAPSFTMATLIPLILILMTVTGAVYPAIDLTAGERERGTLEALISAPVPRHELLFAKFLAVLTVAILTAIANLASMVTTAYSAGMENLIFGAGGVSLRTLALMFGLLIVFAAFFASVILILTSFARSFKEAQAYLIPLMLVSLAPGVLCLLPGIEMTGWMSVTPLVNIVILARDIFDGHAQSVFVLTTLASTVFYSAVALSMAARIFGTDAVLYGSEGSWADLVRRPATPQPAPSLSQAMAALAILLPAFLILKGIPGRFAGESPAVHLTGNAILTIALFALFPLLLAQWSAISIKNSFHLQSSTFLNFIAAGILGLSLWPFAFELARFESFSIDETQALKELLDRIRASWGQIPFPAKLLALAIIPAVCEELFFRGYLLSGLRTGMSTPLAIILSSCLFGLFHVVATQSFGRFVPTTFLGLILGWICCQTGSILPGMLMHAMNNAFIISVETFKDQIEAMGIGTGTEQHLPIPWLITAAIVASLAATMIAMGNRRSSSDVLA